MSGRIVRLGGDEHDFVQLLLPWIDSGCLDPSESARVNAHLNDCPRCRTDVAWQRGVSKAVPGPESPAGMVRTPADVDRGWVALRGRLESRDRADPGRSVPPPTKTRMSPARAGWWRWVLALQSSVVAGLVVVVIAMLPREGAYHALGGAGPPSAASVVVVFRPDASEQQIRQALRDSDARLVDGPTVTGAYLLGVAPGQHATAIERLRLNSAVLRVESLAARPSR